MTGAGRGKRGRRIAKAPEPLKPGAITTDDVAGAFDKARVNRPSADELARLAAIFTQYKQIFLEAAQDREINESAAAAGHAIRTLAEALPKLLDYHVTRARLGDPYSDWQADACRDLLMAVQRADVARIEGQSNVPNVVRDWRWFAAVIRGIIAPALEGVTGTAKGGPASRFLAAIIPLVTGEAPSAVAIATQLTKLGTGEK